MVYLGGIALMASIVGLHGALSKLEPEIILEGYNHKVQWYLVLNINHKKPSGFQHCCRSKTLAWCSIWKTKENTTN